MFLSCLCGSSALLKSLMTPSTTPSLLSCRSSCPPNPIVPKSVWFSGATSTNQSANSASSDETGRNQSAKTHLLERVSQISGPDLHRVIRDEIKTTKTTQTTHRRIFMEESLQPCKLHHQRPFNQVHVALKATLCNISLIN